MSESEKKLLGEHSKIIQNRYMNALHWIEKYVAERDAKTSLSELRDVRKNVSNAYRAGNKKGFHGDAERFTYLLSRFPATYHACYAVFSRMKAELPYLKLTSSLDLGAGPGTATLALAEVFSNIGMFACLEEDNAMARIGGNIQKHVSLHASWIHGNGVHTPFVPSDLVVVSYVLTEISKNAQLTFLKKAWDAAGEALVLISPGSSLFFKDFLTWRTALIEWGATIAAPCPNEWRCPMTPEGDGPVQDWCHFKARVQRTKAMRHLKSGSASYEDEPYSYLIAVRKPLASRPKNRIVLPPESRGGHQIFTLCEEGSLKKRIVSKKESLYKSAKKLNLGDVL